MQTVAPANVEVVMDADHLLGLVVVYVLDYNINFLIKVCICLTGGSRARLKDG